MRTNGAPEGIPWTTPGKQERLILRIHREKEPSSPILPWVGAKNLAAFSPRGRRPRELLHKARPPGAVSQRVLRACSGQVGVTHSCTAAAEKEFQSKWALCIQLWLNFYQVHLGDSQVESAYDTKRDGTVVTSPTWDRNALASWAGV